MSTIIRVTDSAGNFCTHEYFLPVCNDSVDWINSPGTCRLRIAGYSNALFSGICGLCQANITNPWDGTFTVFSGPTAYFAAASFTSVGGYTMPLFQTKIENIGGLWQVRIYCSTPGASILWQSLHIAATSPLGTYAKDTAGCGGTGPGPASIVIEGFTP